MLLPTSVNKSRRLVLIESVITTTPSTKRKILKYGSQMEMLALEWLQEKVIEEIGKAQ